METAQTADYALLMLMELERADDRSVAELAAALGVSRSVAQRVVVTLHARAMVVRGQDGKYALGPRLIAIARNVPGTLAFVARPFIGELSELIGETVVLARPVGDEAEVVAAHGGATGPLRIDYEAGFRHSLTTGASGLAILANSEPEVGSRLLPDGGEQLEAIRSRGFSSTTGEIRDGMAGVAVPVLAGERLVGSLAIILPLNRSARASDFIPDLMTAARRIGDALVAEDSLSQTDPSGAGA